MNDIKKVLIVAISVVLVIAIVAGVSIGVMANTMNGLKDSVEELKQANESQKALNASMQAELEKALANDEKLVTAEDFEAKLAAALGDQTQTMQSLINAAVKSQIEELETEGLTEAQVNQIINAAVANCLTEDDINEILANNDGGLTEAEVKKLITNANAGYLTYAQIVNLIDDNTYDLRKYLEDMIEGIQDGLTTELIIYAEDAVDGVYTLNNKAVANLVDTDGASVVLCEDDDWSDITLVIDEDLTKSFTIVPNYLNMNESLDTLIMNNGTENIDIGEAWACEINNVIINDAYDVDIYAMITETLTVKQGVVYLYDQVVEATITGEDVYLYNAYDILTLTVEAVGASVDNYGAISELIAEDCDNDNADENTRVYNMGTILEYVDNANGLTVTVEGNETGIAYVTSASEFFAAIVNGGSVALANDIHIESEDLNTDIAAIRVGIAITNDTVIDLNGYEIVMPDTGEETTALIHVKDADLTIKGEGMLHQKGTSDYLLWAKGDSTVTIEGGTFVTEPDDCSVLYASGNTAYDPNDDWATINVYGGTFISGSAEGQDCANIMNHGVGRINYYGGTFNWHPENDHDNGGSDHLYINVAEGYAIIDNGDGTYSVLPEDVEAVAAEGIHKLNTGNKTYRVISKEGLLNLDELLAGAELGEGKGATIELACDVDLLGVEWEPITRMWVTFNGNGHTISNLATAESWRAGLFGYAGAVTINDLTLENVAVFGSQAGAFAGAGEGLTINNCYLKGNNTIAFCETEETWNGVGAITGVLQDSTINVTIDEDATVTIYKNDMTTAEGCAFVDNLTGYITANKGTVVNNGTVTVE